MDIASLPRPRIGRIALTAFAPAVWGTTYLVTTELLPAGHPLFAGAMRALPAGVLALALARSLPAGAWWWRTLVLGTLNIGAFFVCLFVAAERLPGGVAATLGAIQPILVAILAAVLVGERVTLWRLGWGVGGLLGVALVVLTPAAQLDPIGVIAGLAGAASMAFGIVLSKRWGRPAGISGLAYAGWLLTAGGLVLLPLALLAEPIPAQLTPAAFGGYLWLGVVGGLIAYGVWFAGIARLPVGATALLGLLSPLVAATLGWIVLGQHLGPVQVLGFGLALAALVCGQLSPRGTARRRNAPEPHRR